jgi:hypothetical protein
MATAAVVANADIWPPVRIGFRPDDQGFQPSLKPLSCSLLQSGWPRLRQACARQLAGGCPQLPGEQTPEVILRSAMFGAVTHDADVVPGSRYDALRTQGAVAVV